MLHHGAHTQAVVAPGPDPPRHLHVRGAAAARVQGAGQVVQVRQPNLPGVH